MKRRYAVILTVIAFLLHTVWENSQAPLYTGYQSFSQHFPICLAGAAGDVAITLFVLLFLRLVKKDRVQTIADFGALGLIGFVVAVLIEQRALLLGKWSYGAAMPIVPWLAVGLSPLLQMTILLPLSFYLANLFNKFDKSLFLQTQNSPEGDLP